MTLAYPGIWQDFLVGCTQTKQNSHCVERPKIGQITLNLFVLFPLCSVPDRRGYSHKNCFHVCLLNENIAAREMNRESPSTSRASRILTSREIVILTLCRNQKNNLKLLATVNDKDVIFLIFLRERRGRHWNTYFCCILCQISFVILKIREIILVEVRVYMENAEVLWNWKKKRNKPLVTDFTEPSRTFANLAGKCPCLVQTGETSKWATGR